MSVFSWTAPLFKLASRRWSDSDFRALAEPLRPYVPPGGVLADLGGGTGELGSGVARLLGARAVIVDPTAQMLRKVDPQPLVSVRLAHAEDLPFPNGYFDALLCCDSFHHFRDQGRAAAEIKRVVRPGGGVAVLDMEIRPGLDHLLVLFERVLGEPAAFRTAGGMESFLAEHGIVGRAESQGGRNYLFLGTVRP